jgi:hypothetical protein
MKAHSRSKGRPTLSRRSQEASNADQILKRIKAVTGELEALQTEIYHQVNPCGGQTPSAVDSSRARLLGEFKLTLDRLRQVLWFYLEQVTSLSSGGVKTKPLEPPPPRTLYPQSPPTDAPGMPTGSFFDRLDVVIDAYMRNAATPQEPGSRKRAKS